MENTLEHILALFLEEAPQRMQILDDAYGASDFDTVARMGHSLANIVGTLRGDEALQAARRVETMARAADTGGIELEIDCLRSALDEMIAVLLARKAGTQRNPSDQDG